MKVGLKSNGPAAAENPHPATQPAANEPTAAESPPTRDPFFYKPGMTLGRSGYIQGAEDRLGARVEQLDALMCLVTEAGPTEEGGLRSLNDHIQHAVLCLAASLAEEIHELHEQTWTERYNARQAPRGAV